MSATDDVPDYQSLMLPVLRAAARGEQRIGAVVERLAGELGLSDGARATLLASGRQTVFANRVHWAKTYLAKAGLVESTRRGHFRLTPRGSAVLADNPDRIDNRFLSRFDEFRQFTARAAEPAEPADALTRAVAAAVDLTLAAPPMAVEQTPDEVMRAAHRRIETALAEELLDRVRLAPPEFFERLIVNLLLAMGYGGSAAEAGRALGRSGDDGVDGVIDQDALGLDRVYIQAKRYASGNSVGSGAIRDFFGSLDRHKAAKGLFVTTSTFTESARQTADYLSKRIVLVNGEHLARLMIRHNVGCRIEEVLHVKKIDEDFFE
ncbi:restriction endonuclease [Ancylobacter lacus]|uniref:restriction endonuclease n=1 Tax=Ancylobacter lacus TaxID=2579970 RepID=UPI001FE7780D|nr:restriction endonuclease [Ancylobacter lacus]